MLDTPTDMGQNYHRTIEAVYDKPRRKIDFVHRILNYQTTEIRIPNSSQPFRIINIIAHNCLEEFIRYTLDILFKDLYEDEDRKLVTSCANNFCCLSTLFMGMMKTQSMMYLINLKPSFKFKITLPSGNHYCFKTLDLFAGNATHLLSLDNEYEELDIPLQEKKVHDIVLPRLIEFNDCIHEFCKKIKSSKDYEVAEAVLIYIKSSKFQFNRSVIKALRTEIRKNSRDVTHNRSYLYCIKTKIPVIKDHKIHPLVEHAILLEQFLSPDDRTTLVRPYQAWIETATLLDDITKRQFDMMGKGAWDESQTEAFFNSFEDYYCSETGYLEPKKAEACFGYKNEGGIRKPLVILHNNFITGVNVRYIIKQFDPTHCLDHLKDILRHIPN